MKKKLIAGMLGACMISSLTGCSDDTSATEASVSETTTATTVATEASAEETTEATTEETAKETTTAETVIVDPTDLLSGFERFELTSADLNDGVWDDVISNTEKGENVSPSLSWEPVEGAELYVIYMVDLDAGYWMHWKADAVTDTDLKQGWAEKGYVGPYPPSGTVHTYDIYVVALKAPVERVKGTVDTSNAKIPEFLRGLDIDADGNSGNIISFGQLSGTFTSD